MAEAASIDRKEMDILRANFLKSKYAIKFKSISPSSYDEQEKEAVGQE
jgi:hypothetical protein